MFDPGSKGFTHAQQQQPVTAVIRNVPPRRVRWSEAGPYIVGIMGVVVAAVALALFLTWKGAVTDQISQLRSELTTAQSQAATTSTGLSGLSGRVDGIRGDVNALGQLFGNYTTVCQQDLTGPNGPAAFDFPCTQHK